jgi:hypothetical protein
MTEFLDFVSRLQRDNQTPKKTVQAGPQNLQLDLFYEEPALVADHISKDLADTVHAAGVNLSDVKVQLAVGAWRERTIAFIRQVLRQLRNPR